MRSKFQCLAGLTFKSCLVFIDDVIIISKTFDEHLSHLTTVFQRIRSAGLKLKPSKCHFAAPKVHYLGHIISKDGVSVDPEKVELIKNFPTPKNQTNVRAFLGISGFYRRFCHDYAKIATPLNELLKSDIPFAWNPDAEKAFITLKEKLITTPILAFPDFKKTFLLYTDASNKAIGYILGQKDDEGREHVIAYGGRALQNAELKYGITEKETLALVSAIKHFRVYLMHNKFIAITDHSAIKYLKDTKDPTGRLGRWALFLQSFDFEVVYKPGVTHKNADVS